MFVNTNVKSKVISCKSKVQDVIKTSKHHS